MFDPISTLSNVHVVSIGGMLSPTEKLSTGLDITYFMVYEELGSDDELGLEIGIHADYHYTDFLNFRAGWAWYDAGDASVDGNVVGLNNLGSATSTSDNYNYLYLESTLHF